MRHPLGREREVTGLQNDLLGGNPKGHPTLAYVEPLVVIAMEV